MSSDPELEAHKEWIGYLQPVGLVVSPPALQKAQVVVSRNVIPEQDRLTGLTVDFGEDEIAAIPTFRDLAEKVLRWRGRDLVEPPEGLEITLSAYQDTLRPSMAVPDPENPGKWLALVQVLSTGGDMDKSDAAHEGWRASPQERLERLLRELDIPVGLLFNGLGLRLVYAPKGETSGHLTFPIQAMTEVGGRPILAGMLCLLDADCIFSPDKPRRLTTLLSESRKYQSTVSNALAGQVLEALHELLRGVQAADEAANGRILGTVVPDHYDHLYAGLVSVLMRLVFLLYAEDRELMPRDNVYQRHYAVGGLYERLRADAGLYPDTMDQRYGAWAHLLALFRLVHDGGKHAGLSLPARNGELFNPDSYPFLEGRPFAVNRVLGERFEAPKVSDGVIWRVLRNLLMLKEERLSYRTLDVEQIGSVYEAIMGFGVERAFGPSIGVKPKNIVVDLAKLIAKPAAERTKFLAEEAECKLPPAVAAAVGAASSAEQVVAALGSRVSPYTPTTLAKGALYLQPGEERRRSGSHYTPRELTAPIVRTTLRPIFEAMGEKPTPEQILALKVCDPAMGSGAFLVEACRQLGERLVEAWEVHGRLPEIPADEEPYLHARRMVAQTCLYGVDKNPMAASLAKLSLWLVTLARDHTFTFLDHALKHGDSLVGFSRLQIASFRWDVEGAWTAPLFADLARNLGRAKLERTRIQALGDDHDVEVRDAFDEAEEAVHDARLKGDLLVAAFFAGSKPKERDEKRKEYLRLWQDRADGSLAAGERVDGIVEELRGGVRSVPAFHWEVEFPEVFDRENGGFDCFVGNPPFAGKNTLSASQHRAHGDWLKAVHSDAHGNADIVAHFFRRTFVALRRGGAFGLIATNTIAQGDTRSTGLQVIRRDGGVIYDVTRRRAWPGSAAVVVSVVHVRKGGDVDCRLDGRLVQRITAFLFGNGPDNDPQTLLANAGQSFIGVTLLGMGFTFDDELLAASPLSTMRDLLAENPSNAERVFPFIGGEEVLSDPRTRHRRYVINFGEMSLAEAATWPELLGIVETKVRGQRPAYSTTPWWQYERSRPEMQRAVAGKARFLFHPNVSTNPCFAFLPAGTLVAAPHNVFAFADDATFSVLQSRIHEVWARFFGSSMKDDLRYTPTDCFETFPRPANWQSDAALESTGQTYYDFRAALMVRNNEGLTSTYNRFHDPEERSADILRLRELHAAMDRAVLDAYGWQEIPTTCEFLLDWEDPEDDANDGAPRRKKKPWRYRWPDEVRDEVLARLLELNRQRAEEERLAATTGNAPARRRAESRPPKPKATPSAGRPQAPAVGPIGALFAGEKK